MKKNIIMVMLLGLMQSGCASIISLKRTPRADISPRDQAYARQVYGGTRTDWHEARSWIPGPSWAWPVGIVIFLDLPFSAVADTVALPFTIPYNLMMKNEGASNKTPEHISEGRQRPSENAQR